MRLLLLHTASSESWVALADTDQPQPLVAQESLPGRGSSEALMPAIRRLFESMAWPVQTLNTVVVVDGPGSFTGVRVGLSAAKGLCEATGARLVTISRLTLIASSIPGMAVALLDAGRGEFYAGHYSSGICLSQSILRHDQALLLAPNAAPDAAPDAGSDAALVTSEPRVAEAFPNHPIRLVPEPDAALTLALTLISKGIWADPALADANYLRRTDAELLFEQQRPLGHRP